MVTQNTDAGFISATHHIMPEGDEPQAGEPTPQPEPTPAPQSTPQEKPQEVPAEEPQEVTVPPELESKYADLDEYFNKRFGAGLEDIFEMLNDLGSFRQQTVYEQQLSTLKSEWGQDFDDRFKVVQEEFKKIPANQQAAYDNVDGARRIWNDYMVRNQLYAQAPNRNINVRTRRVQTAPQSQQSYDYTYQDIEDMARSNPQKYDAERDRITQAFLNGRVKY